MFQNDTVLGICFKIFRQREKKEKGIMKQGWDISDGC